MSHVAGVERLVGRPGVGGERVDHLVIIAHCDGGTRRNREVPRNISEVFDNHPSRLAPGSSPRDAPRLADQAVVASLGDCWRILW